MPKPRIVRIQNREAVLRVMNTPAALRYEDGSPVGPLFLQPKGREGSTTGPIVAETDDVLGPEILGAMRRRIVDRLIG